MGDDRIRPLQAGCLLNGSSQPRGETGNQGNNLIMNIRNSSIVAMLLVGGSLLPGQAPAAQAPPKALTQQEALERITQGLKQPVIAEVTAPARRLPESTSFDNQEEAWKALSLAFDLHVVRRPGGIALHRRYTDLVESPSIPREEMRRTFTDLDTLLRPFVPYPLDVKYIERQNHFANNLKTEQIEQMRAGGLAFRQLSMEQQAQWLQINAANVYSEQNLVIERTARRLNQWTTLDLVWRDHPEAGTYLVVTDTRQHGSVNLTHNCRGIAPLALLPGSVVNREERSGLPSAWNGKVSLESGEQKVSTIVTAMEAATRLTIEVPDYARENLLMVIPGEARAVDIAASLEDIYGWELRYVRGKSWILDRPRFGPARNAVELHVNMLRAIPPPLRFMLGATNYRERLDLRSLPKGRPQPLGSLFSLGSSHRTLIYQRMMAEINRRHGVTWKKLHVADLPDAVQRKVANLIPLVDALGALSSLCLTPQARARVVSPQEGWFTVGGEPGQPLKGTALMFHVKGPDGKTDTWGWGVGTSSLEQ